MERPDLRRFGYALIASPVLIAAAACGARGSETPAQNQPPSGDPPQSGQVKGELSEPTLIVPTPQVEDFGEDGGVTLGQIIGKVQELPGSIHTVDMLDYLTRAQGYEEENPQNQDIYNDLDLTFQILNLDCKTDDHVSVARLIDQYVRDNNSDHYEAKKASLYSTGPCGTALAGTNEEPTKSDPDKPGPEKTVNSTDDRIYINDYYLYTDIESTIATMVDFVENPRIDSYRDFLVQNGAGEVRGLITTIKNKWQQNPNDPSMIDDSIMIANLVQGKDDGTIRCKTFMLFGATIGHAVDPENYPAIEHNFRGRGCDW